MKEREKKMLEKKKDARTACARTQGHRKAGCIQGTKKFILARAGTLWGGTGQRVKTSREARRDRA